MFVLKDTHATKKRNKPVFLKCMTGIGPCYTESIDEAEKFKTEQDAMQSPAYYHSLCFFEPVELTKKVGE